MLWALLGWSLSFERSFDMDNKFSKRQILGSQKYRDFRDVLSALLNDTQYYSADEVDEIIEAFGDKIFNSREADVL